MLTCQSKLKKLAKILVGSNPEFFPSCEDHTQAFQDQPVPEIWIIAARLEKARVKAKSENIFHDPDHICNLIIPHFTQFAFLNNPPMVAVSADPFPVIVTTWPFNRANFLPIPPLKCSARASMRKRNGNDPSCSTWRQTKNGSPQSWSGWLHLLQPL